MTDKSANNPVTFARDVIWVGVSLVFTSLLGIITLPVLTKTYSSATYGVWSQVFVTVTLLTPLVTLQFSTAIVRFLAGEDDKEKRRRWMGSMLLAVFSFACIMFLAANLLAPLLSNFLFADPAYITFVRLTFLWTFIESLYLFSISYLRARGRIKQLSVIQIILISTKILLIVLLPPLGLGLEWVIICIVAAEAVFTLGVYSLVIKDTGFLLPNFDGLTGFLAFSAPQIPSGILLWIISASDRYFITHFLNLSQTGIYSSSYLLASVITLFFAPIGYVLLPTVSRAWEQNRTMEVKNYLEYSIRFFLTLGIPAAAGVAMLSQPLLNILTTSEFLAGKGLVLLVAIGTIFQGIYQINLYVMYLVKQTKWLPLMILGATMTSAGLNFFLIPRVGIIGAGISNICAYFVLAAIVTIWAHKVLHYGIDLKYLGKVITATLVMAVCLNFITIDGIVGIALSIMVAVVVLVMVLLLLKAFSSQDRQLVKRTFVSFMPWMH